MSEQLPPSEGVDSKARPWLAAYAPGVPADIPPVTESLIDMLDASVARYRRSVALEFFGVQTTYGQLGEQVARAAEGLRKLGVKAGDRVAIILPNCPQHVVAFYAALRLGAIVVEHNPLYTARELRHQFEVHEAVVAVVWDKVADTIAEFPSDIAPRSIVAVRMTDELPFGTRLALRLPIPKARASRNALTQRPQAKGIVPWTQGRRGASDLEVRAPPLGGGRRGAAAHQRDDRTAQGRHPEPPKPPLERRAVDRLGA